MRAAPSPGICSDIDEAAHARPRWFERSRDADRLVGPIWVVPEHCMSSPARDFAERVVRRNYERLMASCER